MKKTIVLFIGLMGIMGLLMAGCQQKSAEHATPAEKAAPVEKAAPAEEAAPVANATTSEETSGGYGTPAVEPSDGSGVTVEQSSGGYK